MEDKTLHQNLIDELFDERAALSPREIAARNEIAYLREQLASQPKEKAAKVAKGKREATAG